MPLAHQVVLYLRGAQEAHREQRTHKPSWGWGASRKERTRKALSEISHRGRLPLALTTGPPPPTTSFALGMTTDECFNTSHQRSISPGMHTHLKGNPKP